MFRSLLLALLPCFGCTAKTPPPESFKPGGNASPQAEESVETLQWMPPIPAEVLCSPFLPALVRAGLDPDEEHVYVDRIDQCGYITVGSFNYIVLYIHREIWLTEYNQRGGNYWLICDTDMRPMWKNPDWGGTPGRCHRNTIKVDLTDKFFAINDEHAYGDLLTFRHESGRLVASINWASDESRIAQFLNWPKWPGPSPDYDHDDYDHDEEVRRVLPVAGHPTWRIVLTQFTGLYHQGCAHLIDENGEWEFGCKSLPGIWSEQACRPTGARSAQLPFSGKAVVWLDWETSSGNQYRSTFVVDGKSCREIETKALPS